jgi:hypothetical protein
MHRIATSASLGAVVTASCLLAGGIAAAAEPSRLCFPAGGGVIELGISRAALSRPGFGLLAGRTFGPDKQHGGCLDFPPRSGGMRSERHAAARMLIPSMPALASAGVR